MGKYIKNLKKSLFIHKQIRSLTNTEIPFLLEVEKVIKENITEVIIGHIPKIFSADSKIRPLMLHKDIVKKIQDKHGKIIIENLIINAHSWDIGIRNLDRISEKINLIKMIPNSQNFLLIGAEQRNGYFILTHFETEVLQDNQLKSLLGRGDYFNQDT